MDENNFDVIVIGGGLLGCFAARNLMRYDLKVALLEKREDLCTGISKANTAIVYSGCDTKPGSLKTNLCVRASQSFSELCEQLGVRYLQCGSLMISFGERGNSVLSRKLEQGTKNGVRGMKILTRKEVLELEPNISPKVSAGLFIPETGTVMPWELCLAAAESAVRNGAEIFLSTEVTGIKRMESKDLEKRSDDGSLNIDSEFMVYTADSVFSAKAIINCAGMSADSILELAYNPVVRIVPTAGDYFILDTKAKGHIKHVIFHEPEEKGKGLTLVPTVDGNILVGPTERKIDLKRSEKSVSPCRESCEVNSEDKKWGNEGFETAEDGLVLLRELVSEVIPTLPMDQVISSFGAMRPNPYMQKQDENGTWVADDKSVGDFCIVESEDGSFISLVGIKTPGLTCSNELGMYIAEKTAAQLGATPNVNFDPIRLPPIRTDELSLQEKRALVGERPEYGHVVCRCRGIAEGEVVSAIRRSPGAVTLDGIKRRTGTDSGRCQGGYCAPRIIEILARELGISVEEVTKRGGDSWVVKYKTL